MSVALFKQILGEELVLSHFLVPGDEKKTIIKWKRPPFRRVAYSAPRDVCRCSICYGMTPIHYRGAKTTPKYGPGWLLPNFGIFVNMLPPTSRTPRNKIPALYAREIVKKYVRAFPEFFPQKYHPGRKSRARNREKSERRPGPGPGVYQKIKMCLRACYAVKVEGKPPPKMSLSAPGGRFKPKQSTPEILLFSGVFIPEIHLVKDKWNTRL